MWPMPAASLPRTSAAVTSSPSTRIVPASGRRRPAIVSTSSPWPLSSTPAMPTISPAAHLEREPADGGQPAIVLDLEPVHLQQRRARRGRLLGDAEQHVAADHHAREALLRRALGRHRLDLLAAPQHAHAVGDLEHLAELVRDEDDRLALRRQRAQDLEQLGGLLGGQHRGRLVEDQHLGAAVERPQDLDALLLADRDVADPRLGVDAEPEAVRQLAHAPGRRLGVEQQPLARLGGEDDVLGHRHDRHEHEVLVDHPDPEVDRLPRRLDRHRLRRRAGARPRRAGRARRGRSSASTCPPRSPPAGRGPRPCAGRSRRGRSRRPRRIAW